MGLIYGDDENNNEKIKLCMVHVKKLANLQLIKPCRVLLERKVETVRLDKVDHVDKVMHRMEMLPKPKTIKQRMKNEQLLRLHHHGHQDDVFESISPIKKRPLLSDSSVMSDNNECSSASSHSSIGPVHSWPVLSTSTPKKNDRLSFPLNLDDSNCQYQHCAYIHKKLKEKRPRELRKVKKRLQLLNEKSNFDSLVDLVKENEKHGPTAETTLCESYFSLEG